MNGGPKSPFQIAGGAPVATVGEPITEPDPQGTALERIRRMVDSCDVFVFMKGQPSAPRCGFSANTVAILEACGNGYATFDVLGDEEIRSQAKQFAGWPTFPQVYVRGEFIGGNDIVTEMYQSGELQRMLEGQAS